jgi:hypothetical protein
MVSFQKEIVPSIEVTAILKWRDGVKILGLRVVNCVLKLTLQSLVIRY